jgi:predicted transposase
MHRTIKLLLNPTPDQQQVLIETLRQFTECFNQVCMVGWKSEEKNGVKLHHATYYPLKEQFPQLVSDLHIQARMKATEALKSAFNRRKHGRLAGQPRSRSCPIR